MGTNTTTVSSATLKTPPPPPPTTTTAPHPKVTETQTTTDDIQQTSRPPISTTAVQNETTTKNITEIPPTTPSTPDVTSGQVEPKNQGSSNVGAIVGGVIGGIVVIAIIMAVIVFIRRRKGRQNHRSLNKLPGKEDLEIHVPPAPPGSASYTDKPYTDKPSPEKPYANLTVTGDTDEQTDPSVGPDGYIKKTKHYHKEAKNCESNGSTSDELPLYNNEDFKPKTRVDSMPAHSAPKPPVATIQGYSTARVGKVNMVDNASGYSDARVLGNIELPVYMDVVADDTSGNRTNQNATGDKTPDKLYVNEPESSKFYENIDKRDYKTVSSDADSDTANKELINATNTPYANVGTERPESLVQDDVYEIP